MAGDHRIHWNRDWREVRYYDGETVCNIKCGHCIGCNQASQREYAIRAFHEAQLHTEQWTAPITRITTAIPNSSVITLTYDDEHLPADGTLRHDDFQRFMKRLRNRRHRNWLKLAKPRPKEKPIRYMMCGEYGGKTARPHYHAIIFGETFEGRYEIRTSDGQNLLCSLELDKLWEQKTCLTDSSEIPSQIGRAVVDDFSFASASYVAGYVAKRSHIFGHQGPIEKTIRDGVTRFTPISPEYRKMSLKPGLGHDWILQPENLAAVYADDSVKISNWTFHPPKYYDVLLDRVRPDLVGDIILNRRNGISQTAEDWTQERCASAEIIALSSLQSRRDSL